VKNQFRARESQSGIVGRIQERVVRVGGGEHGRESRGGKGGKCVWVGQSPNSPRRISRTARVRVPGCRRG